MSSFSRSTQLVFDDDKPILSSIINQGETKPVGMNAQDLNGQPIDISGVGYAINVWCDFRKCAIESEIVDAGPYTTDDYDPVPSVRSFDVTKDGNNLGRFVVRIPIDLWPHIIPYNTRINPCAHVYIEHGDPNEVVQSEKWLIAIDRGVPSLRLEHGSLP